MPRFGLGYQMREKLELTYLVLCPYALEYEDVHESYTGET